MITDFAFIKDTESVDNYIGYAVFEISENEELKYIIFKYNVDLKNPTQIEVEAEMQKGTSKDLIGTISIILDLNTCTEEDFVKKIQQSIKVMCSKYSAIKNLCDEMYNILDVTSIYKFFSDIEYIIRDMPND